jgi:hypothetical protein
VLPAEVKSKSSQKQNDPMQSCLQNIISTCGAGASQPNAADAGGSAPGSPAASVAGSVKGGEKKSKARAKAKAKVPEETPVQEMYREIGSKILAVKKLQLVCKQQLVGKFSTMVLEELDQSHLSLKEQYDKLEEALLVGTSTEQTDALVAQSRKVLDTAEQVLEFCNGRLQRAA